MELQSSEPGSSAQTPENFDRWIVAGQTAKHYWRDLWEYRELFFILAWCDVAVRYKQTVAGASWALLQPFFDHVDHDARIRAGRGFAVGGRHAVCDHGFRGDAAVVREKLGEAWFYVYALNPLVFIIEGFRWSILGGQVRLLDAPMLISFVTGLLLLVTGVAYFRKTERVFADVV